MVTPAAAQLQVRMGCKRLWKADLEVEPVVLIRRLGHDDVVGHGSHALAEGHHRVRDANLSTPHEVVLQVLQADLQVQLSSTCMPQWAPLV